MLKARFQSTEKVPKPSHTYQRLGCGAMNCARFGGRYFQIVKHKGNVRALLLNEREDKQFHTTQVISPSEARRLIGWLARYIAYSDPDPISLAIAASKSHANGVIRNQDQIAKELGMK